MRRVTGIGLVLGLIFVGCLSAKSEDLCGCAAKPNPTERADCIKSCNPTAPPPIRGPGTVKVPDTTK
jgi:hypothetical protein